MPRWRACGAAYGSQQTRNGHRGVAPCYDHAVEQPVAADSAARLQNWSVKPKKTHYVSPLPDLGGSMKRVTGIGGIFFKAKDAPALQAWYKQHLGIDVQEWGGTAFTWTDGEGKPVAGTTVWSIGSVQGDHFAPSTAAFMVNYRVENLHALVKALREEGCNVLEKIDESEYGKFAWVIDPEGNKVELWQPPAGQ
jgi:predicted enzyme related to lactoylglutathione lyase